MSKRKRKNDEKIDEMPPKKIKTLSKEKGCLHQNTSFKPLIVFTNGAGTKMGHPRQLMWRKLFSKVTQN